MMADQVQSMESVPTPTARERARVLGASFIGTTIEWYDFFLYGSATALVFAPQFFPSNDPLAGTLAAFGAFAVGFVARPVGGIVMGYFGDRVGRKSMLLLSMIMMGAATMLIGLLPNYAAIGALAPILLVTLRFVQGLGVGGEWGGAALMAVEYSPPKRRALYGAIPQTGVPAGIILANLIFIGISAALAPEAFAAWGWRIPFLVSGVLILVGLYLRFKVSETPSFREAEDEGEISHNPLLDLLRNHTPAVLLGALISLAAPVIGYLSAVFMLSYGTRTLQIPSRTMLWIVVGVAVVQLIATPLCAVIADRMGHKRSFILGAVLVILWAVPMFKLVDTGRPGLILLALGVAMFVQAFMTGPQGAVLAGVFPTKVRYSGASLSYQIAAVFGGGIAPLVATALLGSFGSTFYISLYVAGLAVISLIAVLALRFGSHADS
ncbi:MFS transporter [Enemella evansiae]|uniref:Putative proline/betaine transporter n=2 Tax=Enemella evansiae TaxID=2016499 RepID=A0A255GBF8_9ACTN|nr:MFS transporter [Enemella evansiae]OYO13248.1 MFS transporter [Enemella evansiae]